MTWSWASHSGRSCCGIIGPRRREVVTPNQALHPMDNDWDSLSPARKVSCRHIEAPPVNHQSNRRRATMNRTTFAIVVLIGLGGLIGHSIAAGFAEPTAGVRGPDAEKITALRKERRDALLEANNAAEQAYRI